MKEDKIHPGAVKGGLRIYDQLLFPVRRFFIMEEKAGTIRGEHAHRECRQLLLCLEGSVELVSDNGNELETTILTPEKGYYYHDIWFWLTIKFLENSKVLVLAEYPYDEDDYLRNYDNFLKEVIK